VLSMCIFPFIAKPLILINMKTDEKHFKAIMEQRKKEIPRFIIQSIKK
jgi:TetR/AcrR family transcriptional regulator